MVGAVTVYSLLPKRILAKCQRPHLAESALLAAIPNQPGLYDPYNTEGNEALITRQHKVLDSMVEQGFVSKADADAAKAEPILDTILPQTSQFTDMKAPHFVQMVRSQLNRAGQGNCWQGRTHRNHDA